MRLLRKRIAMRIGRIVLTMSLLLAGSVAPAFACSCARNPTAESLLQDAVAVFTGTVRDSRPVAPGVSVTTFQVTEGFKGTQTGAIVRVRHPSGSSASCGVRFERGGSYTLAAHQGGSGPALAATLCSTWMFLPQVGLGAELIERMRALRSR
jgi:hypothetical protein